MKESRYVLRGTLVFDTKENKKMYPVGKWVIYQHVFYNYNDICYNEMYDKDHTDESIEKFERSQEILEKWDSNPRHNNIVYAYYEDYKEMKDIIGAYAWRHNGRV